MSPPVRESKSRPLGRVRQRLRADLGWLRSFPLRGLDWMWLPEPGDGTAHANIVISRADLARATRSAKHCHGKERATLKALVGDPDQWLGRTLAIIDALKPRVHHGSALPDIAELLAEIHSRRTARAIISMRRRGLGGIVDPLGWIHASQPTHLAKALRWLDANGNAITRVVDQAPDGQLIALRLADLALIEGKRVDPLLDAFAAEGFFTTPLQPEHHAAQIFGERRNGKETRWPDPPQIRHAHHTAELLWWLCSCPPKSRRAALELVGTVLPGSWLTHWRDWWRKQRQLVTQAQALTAVIPLPAKLSGDATNLARKLRKHHGRRPPSIDMCAIGHILGSANNMAPKTRRALIDLLRVLPQDISHHPLRLSTLLLVINTQQLEGKRTDLVPWLRAMRRFVSGQPDRTAAMAPHTCHRQSDSVPTLRDHWIAETDLLEQEQPAAAIEQYYAALTVAYTKLGTARAAKVFANPGAVAVLVHFAARQLSATAAAMMAIAAHETKLFDGMRYVDGSLLRLAWQLCGDDTERFAMLLEALDKGEAIAIGSDDDDDDDLLGIAAPLAEPGAAALLAPLALNGEIRRLASLGSRVRLLATIGAEPVAVEAGRRARHAAWMRRYPAEFANQLKELAAVHPDPDHGAAQLLGKTFPDPQALRTEIAAINERLAGAEPAALPRLRRRLVNLERRLTEPPTPSARKLESLLRKLAESIRVHTVDAWQARLDARIAATVGPLLFGKQDLPSWLLETPCSHVLPHLLTLTGHSKRLAVRLLRARAGPYPWDLRDAPNNRAFISTLDRRDLDTRPWLDGIGIHAFDTPLGRLFMQLERDPLEALMMGQHFGTCLSAGAFNFFSAVTNAADINKRVVYGRDQHGVVVGRSLFALTDEGHIVTFHPYCHDKRWGYEDLARAFALRLAEQMGGDVSSEGEVSNLVARSWYDDGPVDQAGRFSALEDGSPLSKAIETVSPDALRSLLHEALAPVGLNAITLPLALRMEAVCARPDLVLTLLESSEAKTLRLETKLRLAHMTYLAGAHDQTRRFVHRHVLPGLERAFDSRRPPDPAALGLLLSLDEPSLLLRIVKRSRLRGIRRWVDEVDATRLWAAGRAYQALQRRQLAASLYRLAMDRASSGLRQIIEAQLSALD